MSVKNAHGGRLLYWILVLVKFIFFIALSLSILVAIHFFIYFSVRFFFVSKALASERAMLVGFSFLAISLPLSMLLNRVLPNLIFKTFYIAASFWMGLAINLVMVFLVVWIFYLASLGVGRFAEFNAPKIFFNLSSAAVFVAIAFSFYGLWKAKFPVLKEMRIHLKNLPAEWVGKKIVQLSDVHLGLSNGPSFMQRVASQVKETDPELILITGDLFDGSSSSFEEFIPSLKALRAKYGVFFVTGNHEGYLEFEKPLHAIKGAGIRTLDNEMVDVLGVQVVGISYPEYQLQKAKKKRRDIADIFTPPYDRKKPTILMFHTPTNIQDSHENLSSQQMNTYFKPDTHYDFARTMAVDLQLSGHTHAGQIFPFNYLAKYFYNGFEYGLHEIENYKIYITSGTGTWGPPIRTWGQSEIVVLVLQN